MFIVSKALLISIATMIVRAGGTIWFGETIRNIFGCGCYFVVECYGSVLSVGALLDMYGPPKNVCCLPVITV